MEDQSKAAVGCLGAALAFFIVVAIISLAGTAIGGTIIYVTWNLVIHAIWKGVPAITFWQAVGLALLVSFIGGCFKAAAKP